MAYTKPIVITHSSIAGNVPNTPDEIVPGSMAVNVTDATLYTKDYTGRVVRIEGDGGNATLASAATLELGAVMGSVVEVTGNTNISTINLRVGQTRTVLFSGAPTLVQSAGLVLPGGTSIAVAAGDMAVFRGFAGGVCRCTSYSFAGSMALPAGSALAPALSTRGDPDTGIYFPAANTVGVVTNGVERVRVHPDGSAAVGAGAKIYLDGINGTGDTYLFESAANVVDLYVGGVLALKITPTGIELAGHPKLEGTTATGATGTGKLVFDTSPTLVSPNLGTPTALVGTNITGFAPGLTCGGAATTGASGTITPSFTSITVSNGLITSFA